MHNSEKSDMERQDSRSRKSIPRPRQWHSYRRSKKERNSHVEKHITNNMYNKEEPDEDKSKE